VVAYVVENHHTAGSGLDFEFELRKDGGAAVFDLVEVHQRGHQPLAALGGPLLPLLCRHVVRIEMRLVLLGLPVVHDLQRFGVPHWNANEVAHSLDQASHDWCVIVFDPRDRAGPTATGLRCTDGAHQSSVEFVLSKPNDVISFGLGDEVVDHLNERVISNLLAQVIGIFQPHCHDVIISFRSVRCSGSERGDAAVDWNDGSGGVGACSAGQEDHGPGDVLRRADPLARVRALNHVAVVFIVKHVSHHL